MSDREFSSHHAIKQIDDNTNTWVKKKYFFSLNKGGAKLKEAFKIMALQWKCPISGYVFPTFKLHAEEWRRTFFCCSGVERAPERGNILSCEWPSHSSIASTHRGWVCYDKYLHVQTWISISCRNDYVKGKYLGTRQKNLTLAFPFLFLFSHFFSL